MSPNLHTAPLRRSILGAFAAVVPWLPAPGAHAAIISVDTKTTSGSKSAPPVVTHKLRLTGMLEPGDADRLREALMRLGPATRTPSGRPTTTIELSSKGGDLSEGFQIGLALKKFNVVAVVRKGDFCLSACALAFLGGAVGNVQSPSSQNCNLEIGGKVGFHNFSLKRSGLREVTADDPVASRLQGFNDARGGTAMLVGYAGEVGMSTKFIASIVGRPVEDYTYIATVGDFLSLRVCPIGLKRPTATLDVQARNVCNHSTGWLESKTPLEVIAIPAQQVRRRLLERLQANMQPFKAKGALASQLASAAVMRVDEAVDQLYDDLRAAGVGLPNIVGPTFKVGRNHAGKFETACYVSLSPNDPDRFDVALQGPKGLSHPLLSPPENSRRLFLFDREDVINPRP